MNKLKTKPQNQYTQNEVEQIEQVNEILISYAVLIGGFIAFFIFICNITKF
jgi:hypothetical protein